MTQSFTTFYEAWLTKQDNLLEQLLILSSNENDRIEECNALTSEVLSHYIEFHNQKIIAANGNPFLMLSAPWLSSFERTLLWFDGFKPSIVFSLAKQGIGEDLSNDQRQKIEVLRAETKREEKEVEKTMTSLQETIVAPPIFHLLMRHETLVNSQISELDEIKETFKERTMMIVDIADALRGSTVSKLSEILNPSQMVKFLTAAVQFTITIRRYGLEKDGQGGATMVPDA